MFQKKSKVNKIIRLILCVLLVSLVGIVFSGCLGEKNDVQGKRMESNNQDKMTSSAEKHETIQYSDKHSIAGHDEKYYFDGDQNKLVIAYTDDGCSYLELKSIKKDWERGDCKEFRYAATIGSYRKDTDAVTEKLFYIMMKSPGYRGGDIPAFMQYSTDKHKWTMVSAENQEHTAQCIYAAGRAIAERKHLENIVCLFHGDAGQPQIR